MSADTSYLQLIIWLIALPALGYAGLMILWVFIGFIDEWLPRRPVDADPFLSDDDPRRMGTYGE